MYFKYVEYVCKQYKEGKKLKPKPNYNSVDLSEVEWEDTEEKVSAMHWVRKKNQLSLDSVVENLFHEPGGKKIMLCWLCCILCCSCGQPW